MTDARPEPTGLIRRARAVTREKKGEHAPRRMMPERCPNIRRKTTRSN